MLYHFGRTHNDRWIVCHICGRKSYNIHDIEHHYCAFCHRFLDDVFDDRDTSLRKEIADLRAQIARKPGEEKT